MKIRIYITLLLLWILTYPLLQMAQGVPAMINYTVDDGLPSSETHDILQDSKGYIWIATDRGVSRYNGYEFENFTTKDGLTDNVVFRLQEDSKGRIWFQTMSFKICYYEDGKFKPYPFNQKLLDGMKHIDAFPLRYNQLIIDTLGSLHASFAQKGGLKITKNGVVSYYTKPPSQEDLPIVVINRINGRQFILSFYDGEGKARVSRYNNDTILIKNENDIQHFGKNLAFHKLHTNHNYSDNFNLLFSPRSVFSYSHEKSSSLKLIHQNYIDPINAAECVDSLIWVGTNTGLYIYNQQGQLHSTLLRNTLISSIYTSDNGIWITSLNKGIFFIPSINVAKVNPLFVSTQEEENWITSIAHNKSQIFTAVAYQGDINIYDRDLNKEKTIQLTQRQNLIRRLAWNESNHRLWIGSVIEHLSYYSKSEVVKVRDLCPTLKVSLGSYDFVLIDSTILLSTAEGFHKLKYSNDQFQFVNEIKYNNPQFQRLYFFTDYNKQVWAGGIYGLSKLIYSNDSVSFQYLGDSIPDLALRITCIAEKDSVLWLGTRGNGIILFDKKSNTSLINDQIGFSPRNINDILINKNQIWVASNTGVSLITENNLGQYTFQQINTASGLSTNEVTCLDLMGDTLLIGTRKGLNVINTKTFNLNDNKKSPIYTEINVNGEPITDTNNIELTYDKNSIDFSYLTFAYGTGGDITYQYQISELDDEWFTTKDRTARFVALLPGEYTFKVRTLKNDGSWTQASTINFSVLPAFWQTWYFWVAVGLVFVIVISAIAYNSIKNANERSEMNARIENLRQNSLSSQMNPHFVFNVLNSILTFLLTNSQRNAAKYLSSFAWLMRKTFNLSKANKITLEEELDVLTSYFRLEKLRISDKITFQLEVDPKLDVESLMVPPLILQPFVENAILHGISQDQTTSVIAVQLTLKGDYIKVVIEDNGIGIDKSKKEKYPQSSSHKSSGLDISKERVALLHKVKNEKALVEIVDLSSFENANKTGTRVTFYLPLTED